jgi:hypothetical protein
MEAHADLRAILTDALRFWERLRLLYNGILAGVVGYCLLPRLLNPGGLDGGVVTLQLFLCAVLANVAYTTAYLVDIPVQLSDFRDRWRRWRFGLFVVGTAFAAGLAWLTTVALFGCGG